MDVRQVPFMRVDTEPFKKALKDAVKYSSRQMPVVINSALLDIAIRSYKGMPIGDKNEIQKKLGPVAYIPETIKRGKNAGKTRKGKQIFTTFGKSKKTGKLAPLVALIINAQRGRNELRGLQGRDMRKAVERKVSARKNSVGFLKSGWLPALIGLSKTLKKRAYFTEARIRGRDKGFYMAAEMGDTGALKATAGIGATGFRISRFGGPAFQDAIEFKTKEMKEHIIPKVLKESLLAIQAR